VSVPGKTSSNDAAKPASPSSVAFPDSFASATSDPAAPAPPRKN
jgi:penicillin-binding protein 1A